MTFDSFSDSALVFLLFVALALPIAGILWARHRLRRSAKTFVWQPEQDYDVELQGESALQPPFTVLKKRNAKND